MTPDQQTPDPAPVPAAAPPPGPGDDDGPVTFTAEELADLRANGVSLDALIAELEARPG